MNTVERNIEEAHRLGWDPEDFGVRSFGESLVEAILAFQRDRFLPETGVAGRRTLKALRGHREALRDSREQRERERGLRELGSTEGYDPGRVSRSDKFVRLHLDESSPGLDWKDLTEEALQGLDRVLVSVDPSGRSSSPGSTGSRRSSRKRTSLGRW